MPGAGRLIEEDADPAEISYYEAFSDPQARIVNKAQQFYEGQYRRRIRRRDAEAKRPSHDQEPDSQN